MKYDMSTTEREIMEVLWEKGEKTMVRDIMDIFLERGKHWKRQTLNTFLARLEEKELITREPGRVEACFSKKVYQSRCCQEILELKFDGKFTNFFCAFYDGKPITEQEADEMIALIERKKKELQ
ncbi:MAG: BlaI/MecI/CopY family transcriptional regulator [Lachnoclostridium sp.]|nr:BlaI/MecI/CopY family transcriptional regulator [Lachnospira sp.]MCM1249493.1 BlaI/MecI/CopY family transcriptional regulator [Lachnoclostridium sp.]MCM1536564.1 BlaI/MecI/CopY family transcriptional regulator [Clostridium sp.]